MQQPIGPGRSEDSADYRTWLITGYQIEPCCPTTPKRAPSWVSDVLAIEICTIKISACIAQASPCDLTGPSDLGGTNMSRYLVWQSAWRGRLVEVEVVHFSWAEVNDRKLAPTLTTEHSTSIHQWYRHLSRSLTITLSHLFSRTHRSRISLSVERISHELTPELGQPIHAHSSMSMADIRSDTAPTCSRQCRRLGMINPSQPWSEVK